ncbi:MAG: hypothetical protein U0800_12505 [Isosphaeraceae bacterium]
MALGSYRRKKRKTPKPNLATLAAAPAHAVNVSPTLLIDGLLGVEDHHVKASAARPITNILSMSIWSIEFSLYEVVKRTVFELAGAVSLLPPRRFHLSPCRDSAAAARAAAARC